MQPRNMDPPSNSDATSISSLGRSEARSTASSYSDVGDALGRVGALPPPPPPSPGPDIFARMVACMCSPAACLHLHYPSLLIYCIQHLAQRQQ